MSKTWPKTSFVKIHEACGGIVRWVEALNQPGVHYTGECMHCASENIPEEHIIPLAYRGDGEYRQAIRSMDLEKRRELQWDDDADFGENQKRFAKQIQGAA